MLTLASIAFFFNWPWYLAWHIEEFTGYYPEWIVEVFGGINHGILEGYECIISFFVNKSV